MFLVKCHNLKKWPPLLGALIDQFSVMVFGVHMDGLLPSVLPSAAGTFCPCPLSPPTPLLFNACTATRRERQSYDELCRRPGPGLDSSWCFWVMRGSPVLFIWCRVHVPFGAATVSSAPCEAPINDCICFCALIVSQCVRLLYPGVCVCVCMCICVCAAGAVTMIVLISVL